MGRGLRNRESGVTRAAAIALGILLVALGGGAFAQPAEAPAAPSEQPPAGEPPAEEAISVPEVIGRATEIERELREIATAAEPLAAIEEVVGKVPATRDSLGERAAEARERIETVASIRSLADIESSWIVEQENLDTWNVALTDRVRDLEQRVERIDEIAAQWQKTREEMRAADAPPAVLERIELTLSALVEPLKQVTARRDELLASQAEIASLLDAVGDVLERVVQARQRLRSGLLGSDAPPLWTALAQGTIDEVVRDREIQGLRRDLEVARDYAAQRRDVILLHLLSIAVGALLLLYLRRMAAGWTEEDESFRASAAILARPYSCALLIGYALTPVFLPSAPSLVYGALGMVGLVPILRLIPRLIQPQMRPTFYALVAFFLVDRARDLVAPLITLERLIFVLEMLAAAVVVGQLLRPSKFSLIRRRIRRAVFAVTALRLAGVTLIVSAFADVLGSTVLALILGEGVLASAYVAVAAYAVYRVIEGVVGVSLRSGAARKLNMVRGHRPLILRRVLRLFRAGLTLAWLYFTLGRFNVRGDLLDALGSVLTAELNVGELAFSLGNVLTFGIVFAVAFYASRLLRFVLEQDVLSRMRLPRGVPYAVTATLHYSIVFLGLLAAFAAGGIDLGKFSILAGALGVGVGFGLQGIVNNFVSGLVLLFERPIQTDDVVEVGALLGVVRRIGIRSSTVRTLDGAEVIVPNANLISDQVVNWTLSDRQRRVDVKVGVKYGTDPERVLALLLQVAADDERILDRPEPDALFLGFGDSSLDFQLRAWTAHYAIWMQIRSDLNVAVNRALRDAGIEIPFPQRDLHLRSVSDGVGPALRSGDADD
jgi:small-conductance mechanosensitive channel